MSSAGERRALQTAVAIGTLVPLSAGLSGALTGAGFLEAGGNVTLDSHVRYLSGLLLAIGLGFASCIPAIEAKTGRFRLLTGIVLVGGLARLYGVAADGWPAAPMVFGLVMELGVTPALCAWQGRVAWRYRA